MDKKEYDELVKQLGKEAADQIQKLAQEIETKLNAKYEEKAKGLITTEQFDAYKKEVEENQLKEINEKLGKMEDVAKDQGTKLSAIMEKGSSGKKTLQEFIESQVETIKELRKSGKYVEFTATQLKAAGVTSISSSIGAMDAPPSSPYAPGIGGPDLEVFDIARNPNFIINKVDLGRTNQSRLAWINETSYEGAAAEVEEGGEKPLTQHLFKVEMSVAKKVAAYIELTDEFEDDLPYLATRVRRMLQEDVVRGWDDAVQVAVIAAARQFDIDGLDDNVQDANYWDAALAMLAQPVVYNFPNVNTFAIHPVTNVIMQTTKNTEKLYLVPPFAPRINNVLVEANKVDKGMALAGDLTQYKVDIYKEFVIKIGWINDNLIKNKFCIVGEIRYHRYISDARKKAIVYDSLAEVAAEINGTQGS